MYIIVSNAGSKLKKRGKEYALEAKTYEEAKAECVKKGLVAKGAHVKLRLGASRNSHKVNRNSNRG